MTFNSLGMDGYELMLRDCLCDVFGQEPSQPTPEATHQQSKKGERGRKAELERIEEPSAKKVTDMVKLIPDNLSIAETVGRRNSGEVEGRLPRFDGVFNHCGAHRHGQIP